MATSSDKTESNADDRLRAIEETAGTLTGVYEPGELESLREDLPAPVAATNPPSKA